MVSTTERTAEWMKIPFRVTYTCFHLLGINTYKNNRAPTPTHNYTHINTPHTHILKKLAQRLTYTKKKWLNLIIDVSFGVDYVFLWKSRGGRGGGLAYGVARIFQGVAMGWP